MVVNTKENVIHRTVTRIQTVIDVETFITYPVNTPLFHVHQQIGQEVTNKIQRMFTLYDDMKLAGKPVIIDITTESLSSNVE